MNSTIKDVAKLSGVSAMTVSRVVTGKGYVSEETRKKILAAMKKLEYRPNRIAQSLINQKTNFISIVVPDISNPFFAELVKGAENYARENGYNVILGDTEGLPQHEYAYINTSMGKVADGILLVAPRLPNNEIVEINKTIPLVIVDRFVPNRSIKQVYADNFDGAFGATEYLITRGHKRIGFISGPRDVLNSKRREEGHRTALKHYHIESCDELTYQGDFRFDSGCSACDYFIGLKEPPTAIFSSNDLMAVGFIQRAREYEVHIPEDISIIGFDDISLSSFITPALTTIRHPMTEMGEEAMRLLLDSFSNKKQHSLTKKFENVLIERNSVHTL